MAVLGINYSQQIEDKKEDIITSHRLGKALVGGLFGLLVIPDPVLNNDKGSTINLRNEIANGTPGKNNDSESSSLERRFEQSISAHITTDNCSIM